MTFMPLITHVQYIFCYKEKYIRYDRIEGTHNWRLQGICHPIDINNRMILFGRTFQTRSEASLSERRQTRIGEGPAVSALGGI